MSGSRWNLCAVQPGNICGLRRSPTPLEISRSTRPCRHGDCNGVGPIESTSLSIPLSVEVANHEMPTLCRRVFSHWNTGSIKPGSSPETESEEDEHFRSGPFVETAWIWSAAKCPACYNPTINVALVDVEYPQEPLIQNQAYPRYSLRAPGWSGKRIVYVEVRPAWSAPSSAPSPST